MSNKPTKNHKTVKDALVDFYVSVKPRKEDEDTLNSEELNAEKEHLQQIDPITLVEYIRSSLDVIVQILVEEKLVEYNKENDDPQEYENLLRKLEGDIRGHIRTELQLKLHSENLQCEIDELEKKVELLKKKNKKQGGISCLTKGGYIHSTNNNNNNTSNSNYTNPNAQLNDDNANKTEVNNYKELLKSYENQTLKLAENERRLKSLLIKKDKEVKLIELNYKDQIRLLNKKIYFYEEKMRSNNSNNNTLKPSTFRDELNYQNNSTTRKTNSATKQQSLPSQKTEKYIRKTVVDHKLEVKELSFKKTKSHGVNKSHSSSFVMKKSNEMNELAKKQDDLLAKLDNCSKKILNKDTQSLTVNKKKGHSRHKSMQNSSMHMKTQKVNMIKEMLFNSNISTHHRKTNSQTKLSEKLIKKNTFSSVAPSNNFVINQTGAPFVNNINIYTTHTHDSLSNNNNNTSNMNRNHNKNQSSNSSALYQKLNPESLRKTMTRKSCSVCKQSSK